VVNDVVNRASGGEYSPPLSPGPFTAPDLRKVNEVNEVNALLDPLKPG